MPKTKRSYVGRKTRNAASLINSRRREGTQQQENIILQQNQVSNNEQPENVILQNQESNNHQPENIMLPNQVSVVVSPNSPNNLTATNINRRLRRQASVPSLYRAAFNYNPTHNYSADNSVVFGSMNKVCSYCKALKFKNETPGMCCANGKVNLMSVAQPPEPLRSLIGGVGADSLQFLTHIQNYNNSFQMTSFGATNIIRDNFMPTFKIQGQIYHRAGSLLPTIDSEYKFLQIYFMGNSEQEIDQRCANNRTVKRFIVEQLQTFFHQHNELISLFKTALELMPSDDHKVVIKADKTPVGEHPRRYNAPQINEVAIVVVGDHLNPRDIVLHRRNDQLQRVYETHRSYDALQYPLIFWQGEDGYHFSLKMVNPDTGK